MKEMFLLQDFVISDLARERIGALVVLKGKDLTLGHFQGGTELSGLLSEALLKSLFDPHSIGHDGAVVINKNRVEGFGYHLPLSKNLERLVSSGTRHAAALGLSELTDALCVMVSEELREGLQVVRISAADLFFPKEIVFEQMEPGRVTVRVEENGKQK